jgi:hypothetical protein
MNENVDIFITGHIPFKKPDDPVYKSMNCGNFFTKDIDGNPLDICDDYSGNSILGMKGNYYSDLCSKYLILKNQDKYPLKDYVGFCHYDKIFDWNTENNVVPNIEELFTKHDVIAINGIYQLIYANYAICHNVNDMNRLFDVLEELNADVRKSFEAYVRTQSRFFTTNMFVMKRDDFIKCYNFIFYVLNKFDEKYHFYTLQHVIEHVKHNSGVYLKPVKEGSTQNNDKLWYNVRYAGYLAERILSWYIVNNFTSPLPLKILGKRF